MKTLVFEDEAGWMDGRRGRITGSKLADLVPKAVFTKENMISILEKNGISVDKKLQKLQIEVLLDGAMRLQLLLDAPKKLAFYEILAEMIALPATDENPMVRGKRLEEEAMERFAKETGKKLDTSLVIWTRDDFENIAVSPDASVKEGRRIKEAVEGKCLMSARHLQAYFEREIPDEYREQSVQYFIINDDLETLYFVFFDPRLSVLDYFVIEITRESVQDKIDLYLEYETEVLKEIKRIVTDLTF